MKKLFTFLMLFSTAFCFSQVEFGVKAGANISKYVGHDGWRPIFDEYYQYKPGFYIGGFANVPLGAEFSIQGDLLFSQTGTILDYTEKPYDFKRTVTDYALAVPIMLQYNFFGFYAEAGWQIKFGLSREYEYEKPLVLPPIGDVPSQTSTIDYDDNDGTDLVYGISFGIGYNISDHFSIGGRYFIESENDDRKEIARVFSFGISYTF